MNASVRICFRNYYSEDPQCSDRPTKAEDDYIKALMNAHRLITAREITEVKMIHLDSSRSFEKP